MAIEKSLYAAPVGLETLMAEPAIEIEIEDPEAVHINIGGLEIDIEPDAEDFSKNLAEDLMGWNFLD